jgi:imidazolonepropionase-like amidohydrolase
MNIEEITKSVILGYHSLEHTTYPDRIYDDVLQMLAHSGTRWSPTVAVDGGDALLLRYEPERLREKMFVAFTPEPYIREAKTGSYLRNAGDHVLRGATAVQNEALREAYHQGVLLHVGTDAPNPECFFGSSLHWEMEFFVRAGLTPLEVIRLATREAAIAVGAEDLGTLAPGQIADMVLLDANPLEDIRQTQSVWRVIKGGRLFNPDDLHVAAPAKNVGQTER